MKKPLLCVLSLSFFINSFAQYQPDNWQQWAYESTTEFLKRHREKILLGIALFLNVYGIKKIYSLGQLQKELEKGLRKVGAQTVKIDGKNFTVKQQASITAQYSAGIPVQLLASNYGISPKQAWKIIDEVEAQLPKQKK